MSGPKTNGYMIVSCYDSLHLVLLILKLIPFELGHSIITYASLVMMLITTSSVSYS